MVDSAPPSGAALRPVISVLLSTTTLAAGSSLALLLAPVLQPAPLSAQAGASSTQVTAVARLDVRGVARVTPPGPVRVRFSASTTAGSRSGPVVSTTVTELGCAGNSRHAVVVRLLPDAGGSPGSGARGGLEWSADGGSSWAALSGRPSTVVVKGEPGRDPDCATVRYRWMPPAGEDAATPPSAVVVGFRAEAGFAEGASGSSG